MPPMAAAVGNADDVRNVAQLCAEPVGQPARLVVGAARPQQVHRLRGLPRRRRQGQPRRSARRNLTDKIWLHGWGEDAIVAMVNDGKTNVMPAQAGRLSDEQIHVLAAYVWSLSQPQQAWRRAMSEPAARDDTDHRRRSDAAAEDRLALREAAEDLRRARCTAGSPAGAGRWSGLTQLVFYGLPWLSWNGRPGGAVRPGGAALLHLRPLVLYPQDFIYLTGAADHLAPTRCSCSPRWPGGCGAALPARRRSTPRSSCGSSARSKATASPA